MSIVQDLLYVSLPIHDLLLYVRISSALERFSPNLRQFYEDLQAPIPVMVTATLSNCLTFDSLVLYLTLRIAPL